MRTANIYQYNSRLEKRIKELEAEIENLKLKAYDSEKAYLICLEDYKKLKASVAQNQCTDIVTTYCDDGEGCPYYGIKHIHHHYIQNCIRIPQ